MWIIAIVLRFVPMLSIATCHQVWYPVRTNIVFIALLITQFQLKSIKHTTWHTQLTVITGKKTYLCCVPRTFWINSGIFRIFWILWIVRNEANCIVDCACVFFFLILNQNLSIIVLYKCLPQNKPCSSKTGESSGHQPSRRLPNSSHS